MVDGKIEYRIDQAREGVYCNDHIWMEKASFPYS